MGYRGQHLTVPISTILFLQEQIKDIIIIRTYTAENPHAVGNTASGAHPPRHIDLHTTRPAHTTIGCRQDRRPVVSKRPLHSHTAADYDVFYLFLQKQKIGAKLHIYLQDDDNDDTPFIVLTETKFSFRCIPVWDWYSPYQTRV